MLTDKLLHRAAKRGYIGEVARLDEEGLEVDSADRVSVCVLCLLILVLFGIGWVDCSHFIFYQWPPGRRTRAAGSRSEPIAQDQCK